MATKKKRKSAFLSRYFINAPTGAGYGIFVSLIMGVILSYLSRLPYLGFLDMFGSLLRTGGVVGCTMGAAIALSLDSARLAVFTAPVIGAFAYSIGGPLAALVAVIAGCELGSLVNGHTKLDVVVVPIVTLVAGGLVAQFIGSPIGYLMGLLNKLIMYSTTLHPVLMGIIIAVVMCLLCSSPISSVFVCTSLGLSGVAAGAAVVGTCANTLGFAVVGFHDNGLQGLIAHGLGGTTYQAGNIARRPLIVVPMVITSAILGAISTTLVVMECGTLGAGMGSGGLIGLFSSYNAMVSSGEPSNLAMIKVGIMLFVAPILLNFLFGAFMKRQAYIKHGEMTIFKI